MELSAVEVRVLGCLVEKQLTTPQQYPLTLNALVLACNQTSNRDPVADYGEVTVEGAVTSVKTMGLVSFVHPSHGRSVLRYRHMLEEVWGLDRRPLALLGVLMLRGPQTPGELRVHTERMVQFADTAEVESDLDALSARAQPLVTRLRRAAGQKEDRYAHLLAEVVTAAPRGDGEVGPGGSAGSAGSAPSLRRGDVDTADVGGETGALRAEFEALRSDVAALRAEVESLRAALGD